MEWTAIFDEVCPVPGASEDEISQFISTVSQPLSISELDEVTKSQVNPFPIGHRLYDAYRPFDPSLWILPKRTLPLSFIDFLKWSNGGWCRTGKREFGFFGTYDVREMLIAYQIPEYMSEALPFALNGRGVFYLFDMRADSLLGEYPIVCSHAGNLGWASDEHSLVANTFVSACHGNTNVEDIR